MPSNQPSQELTFRDVLSQIDRRLSLLEEDLRSLRAYIDTRFDAVMARFDTAIGSLETRVDSSIGSLGTRFDVAQKRTDARFDAIEDRFQGLEDRWDRKFRWLIGLSFAGWLSMMTAILLK